MRDRDEIELDRQDAEAFRGLPEALRRLANTPEGMATLLAEFGEGTDEGKSGRVLRPAGTWWEGRRSLVKELADKGLLPEQRVSLEVLFLLPEGFIDFYIRLFHQTFSGGAGESVMGARDKGGLGRAKGAKGIVGGSDTALQASTSGKRWKNTSGLTVRSDKAMAVKQSVDQGLQELMRQGQLRLRSPGESRACKGTGCRRFLRAEWNFCPTCGTPVGERSTAVPRAPEGRSSQEPGAN